MAVGLMPKTAILPPPPYDTLFARTCGSPRAHKEILIDPATALPIDPQRTARCLISIAALSAPDQSCCNQSTPVRCLKQFLLKIRASAAFIAVDGGWLSSDRDIAMNDNEATRSGNYMRLSWRRPRRHRARLFTDHYTISDGNQIIELYHVDGLNHSDNI
jgi:hypothetical protein